MVTLSWGAPSSRVGVYGAEFPVFGIHFVHTLALTFVHAAAEAALEAPAALDELHEGAHVGFAAVAAHGPRLPVVHQVEGRLQGASQRAPL